jgi:hypothetical protein
MTERELAAALFKLREVAPEMYRAVMQMIKAALRSFGIK